MASQVFGFMAQTCPTPSLRIQKFFIASLQMSKVRDIHCALVREQMKSLYELSLLHETNIVALLKYLLPSDIIINSKFYLTLTLSKV
jgi:hypothetical protein